MEKNLIVNEMFSSYQGEGRTVGLPSIFLRMQGCNLRCDFCDTKYALNTKETAGFSYYTPQTLATALSTLFKLEKRTHLVITGGEPLLQQEGLLKTLFILNQGFPDMTVEVETNGLITPQDNWFLFNTQFNVSYKEVTHISKTINVYKQNDLAIFKVVFDPETKLGEKIFLTLRNMFSNSCEYKRIYLMPECINEELYLKKAEAVYRVAQEQGVSFGTRFHILAKIK